MLKSSEEILKTLRATPVVLRAMVAGIDDGGLRRRPAAGEGHYRGRRPHGRHRGERLRSEHLYELESLSEPGWERTGRHGQHGEMSIGLYEMHVAAEEVDHLAQIARLL